MHILSCNVLRNIHNNINAAIVHVARYKDFLERNLYLYNVEMGVSNSHKHI